MEFRISDLLDDFQDSSVELHPRSAASPGRIRELTMKKIQNENKKPRQGLRSLSRVILVAAVILALATTALAASGFRFSDWIKGNGVDSVEYDRSVSYGSASMNWEASGWVVNLSAVDAVSTGLTLECAEQGWERQGTLTIGAEFWLEHWDGVKYVPMEPKTDGAYWTEGDVTIAADELVCWDIRWEDAYGKLESGYYRIGFPVTLDSGKTERMTFYAKFRVYLDEMLPYVQQCRDALENLLTQENYHLTCTKYPTVFHDHDYTYYTTEVWKNGTDYLEERKYILETEKETSLVSRRGELLRDGVGYTLEWEGDSVRTPVSAWERADYIDEGNFDLWAYGMGVGDARLGEVLVDGNVIILLGSTYDAYYTYKEERYTFGDAGKLLSIEEYYLTSKECPEEEKMLYTRVEVHGTTPEEIGQIIDAQDVTTPNSFSWADDQAAYSDAQRTGFVNTAAQPIESWEDAVRIAQADSTMTTENEMVYQKRFYNIVVVFHDDSAGIWKVEYSASQNDYFQAVYLDENGITKMVVNGEKEE